MRLRLLPAVSLLLLVAPSFAFAGHNGPWNPVHETLVEGHTVFTVISALAPVTTGLSSGGAAVPAPGSFAPGTPGLAWFNDQYALNPAAGTPKTYWAGAAILVQNDTHAPPTTYPCGGVVLAVPEDAPYVWSPSLSDYVASYRVTDPNGRAWIIDKWSNAGEVVWTVPVRGNTSTYFPLSPANCAPFLDTPCASSVLGACRIPGHVSPGTHGWRYPCGNATATCVPLRYNAYLAIPLHELQATYSVKDHRPGTANSTDDVAGCDASASTWPCPSGDDEREGNSHPYAPTNAYPVIRREGRGNHGGSAHCHGDAALDQDCHATVRLKMEYGYAPVLTTRTFVVNDTQGNGAPFHCHDDVGICNEGDLT